MTWSAVWPALAGAVAQEVLHWYGLRTRLDHPEVRRVLRSPGYWIVTLAMIVVSGIGVTLVHGADSAHPGVAFVLGAAFPMLLKKLVAVAVARPPDTGSGVSGPSWWRRYLEAA